MPSRLGSLTQSTKDRVIKNIKEITAKPIDTISSLDNAPVRIVSDPDTINHNGDSSRRVYASYYHLSARVYSGCSLQQASCFLVAVGRMHPENATDASKKKLGACFRFEVCDITDSLRRGQESAKKRNSGSHEVVIYRIQAKQLSNEMDKIPVHHHEDRAY